MIKLSLITCVLTMACFADTVTYVSKNNVDILKSPSGNASTIKTIKKGEIISGTSDTVNGYIPIIGGYAKASDLMPVNVEESKAKNGKSVKAIVDSMNTEELPVSYLATVTADNVLVRNCPSTSCSTIDTKSKGDVVEIIAKTADGSWYKSESSGYISGKYLSFSKKEVSTKSDASNLIAAKVNEGVEKKRVLDKDSQSIPTSETIDLGQQPKQVTTIETTTAEKSDDLYAHSGEIAKKYPNEALIRNLTKTATPMPVKIPARYARALDFPMLNKEGDVYTDYTYVWIKIKDEEFVLGNREGKNTTNSGQFTINKKVN